MSNGKAIPVWYSEEERRRVEEAAVLAGYKYLSKYIRDKSLNRGDYREPGRDSMEAWSRQQELGERLAAIESNQKTLQATLAMLLFLIRRKATSGEVNDLRVALENAGTSDNVLTEIAPELGELIKRFAME